MRRLINITDIKVSKNFESKVLRFFPKDEQDRDIYISSVGVVRNYGYEGNYKTYVDTLL